MSINLPQRKLDSLTIREELLCSPNKERSPRQHQLPPILMEKIERSVGTLQGYSHASKQRIRNHVIKILEKHQKQANEKIFSALMPADTMSSYQLEEISTNCFQKMHCAAVALIVASFYAAWAKLLKSKAPPQERRFERPGYVADLVSSYYADWLKQSGLADKEGNIAEHGRPYLIPPYTPLPVPGENITLPTLLPMSKNITTPITLPVPEKNITFPPTTDLTSLTGDAQQKRNTSESAESSWKSKAPMISMGLLVMGGIVMLAIKYCKKKTSEEHRQQVEEHKQPVEEQGQPVEEHGQPVEEHKQPVEEHERPVEEHKQSVEEHGQPVEEHGQPVEEHGQPVEEHGQPVEEHERPVEEHKQSVEEHGQLVEEQGQLVEEHERPVEEHKQPVEEHERPVEEHKQPVEEHGQPVEEYRQLVEEQGQVATAEPTTGDEKN